MRHFKTENNLKKNAVTIYLFNWLQCCIIGQSFLNTRPGVVWPIVHKVALFDFNSLNTAFSSLSCKRLGKNNKQDKCNSGKNQMM